MQSTHPVETLLRLALGAAALAVVLAGSVPVAAWELGFEPPSPQHAGISAHDLKLLDYLENAHGQMEEWSARLAARLAAGIGPRPDDPVLDGRAPFQAQKLRITYAPRLEDAALAAAFEELADAHDARLSALREMAVDGYDADRMVRLDCAVATLIDHIRDWRPNR